MFTPPDRIDRDDAAPYVMPRRLFETFQQAGQVQRIGGSFYLADGVPIVICDDHKVRARRPPLWRQVWAKVWIWLTQ